LTAESRRREEACRWRASSRSAALLAFTLLSPSPAYSQKNRTENVILAIADGIRPRELFEGVDGDLFREADLWSEDRSERRKKLMPFFWSEVGRRGLVLGNRALSSAVSVKNPYRLSASGHAEILTGEPQESVEGDEPGFSPRSTILEFIREKTARAPTDVAAFASWERFERIAMRSEGAIVCNAGYQPIPPEWATPDMALVETLQLEMMTPWDSLRHDALTLRLALEYMERYEPRLLVVSLGEMEAWAVEGRYDRMARAIRFFDDALRRLWTEAQSRAAYRDKTTLIVTTTHGHGSTTRDWSAHGPDVPGGEETWIAILGPDTPARGEARGTKPQSQSNVAATVLELLDLNYQEFNRSAGAPIEGAMRER